MDKEAKYHIEAIQLTIITAQESARVSLEKKFIELVGVLNGME